MELEAWREDLPESKFCHPVEWSAQHIAMLVPLHPWLEGKPWHCVGESVRDGAHTGEVDTGPLPR